MNNLKTKVEVQRPKRSIVIDRKQFCLQTAEPTDRLTNKKQYTPISRGHNLGINGIIQSKAHKQNVYVLLFSDVSDLNFIPQIKPSVSMFTILKIKCKCYLCLLILTLQILKTSFWKKIVNIILKHFFQFTRAI
jgi:hypothetical protein